jgi:hypothetical protein
MKTFMPRHLSVPTVSCARLVMLAPMLVAGTVMADQPVVKTPPKRPANPALAPIVDTPGLPRVLLIGDSISIGYTLPTRELLAGKANVHRIPANGGPTTNGLAQIDRWLGDGKWDVIHFNWGLHDLKFIDGQGRLTDPASGSIQVPLEEYERNLRQLVERLERTGAKLIWCSTTPVPQGAVGRVPGDELKYNAVAAKVMAEEQVAVDDLYAFAKPQLDTIGKPADVHYTPEGSRVLATQVARSIEAALAR